MLINQTIMCIQVFVLYIKSINTNTINNIYSKQATTSITLLNIKHINILINETAGCSFKFSFVFKILKYKKNQNIYIG